MLDKVHDEDFLAFEKAAKEKLIQKVHEHPYISAQAKKIKEYNTLSDTFKNLNDKYSGVPNNEVMDNTNS
jgi:acetyl-CoA carboxylase carboxyltransferase component